LAGKTSGLSSEGVASSSSAMSLTDRRFHQIGFVSQKAFFIEECGAVLSLILRS